MARTPIDAGLARISAQTRANDAAHKLVTERKTRQRTKARESFVHRVKNGLYDPLTYFHLIQELLTGIEPGRRFNSAQLAEWLNKHRRQFRWDAVTIGRILNDIVETMNELNPGEDLQPIKTQKTWAGMYYQLAQAPAARATLYALLDDLTEVGQEVLKAEEEGCYVTRLVSPLTSCASITSAMVEM